MCLQLPLIIQYKSYPSKGHIISRLILHKQELTNISLFSFHHLLLLLGALRRGLLRLRVVLGEESLGSFTLRYDDSVALLDVRLACCQLKRKGWISNGDLII